MELFRYADVVTLLTRVGVEDLRDDVYPHKVLSGLSHHRMVKGAVEGDQRVATSQEVQVPLQGLELTGMVTT